MNKFEDITGETFGERLVLGLSHQNPRSRNYYWLARCSCGREDVVSGTNLRRKTSCVECSGRKNGRKGLYSQSKGMEVYFIKCEDYVKVGASRDTEKRLKILATYNPFDLELLKVDRNHTEEYWHEKLKKLSPQRRVVQTL